MQLSPPWLYVNTISSDGREINLTDEVAFVCVQAYSKSMSTIKITAINVYEIGKSSVKNWYQNEQNW